MYQVINNLPIDYDFQSKTKEELKLYAKWFEENKVFLVEFVDEKGGYDRRWNGNGLCLSNN